MTDNELKELNEAVKRSGINVYNDGALFDFLTGYIRNHEIDIDEGIEDDLDPMEELMVGIQEEASNVDFEKWKKSQKV